MVKKDFDPDKIQRFADLLRSSKSIIITCHLSPDGDALGSSLGLKCVLSKLNPEAKVHVITPDEPTKTLSFLPHYNRIIAWSHFPGQVKSLLSKCDLLICLDFNELNRTDQLAPLLRQCNAIKVNIDHHLQPEDFADILFSYPQKPATCMLLYEILIQAGLVQYISPQTAASLLTGILTDTGDLSYNITDPNIYNVVGQLIELGADKSRLTRILFNTFSESCLRIQGYALAEKMKVFHDTHAALIVLTRDELNKFNYQKGDTEGLVNKPLSIPGILYSCYLREESNYIKVSMRSLGDFPVNQLCSEYFGGGGHLNAAGGEFHGTMQDCINTFCNVLDSNKKKYIDNNPSLQIILDEELKRN